MPPFRREERSHPLQPRQHVGNPSSAVALQHPNGVYHRVWSHAGVSPCYERGDVRAVSVAIVEIAVAVHDVHAYAQFYKLRVFRVHAGVQHENIHAVTASAIHNAVKGKCFLVQSVDLPVVRRRGTFLTYCVLREQTTRRGRRKNRVLFGLVVLVVNDSVHFHVRFHGRVEAQKRVRVKLARETPDEPTFRRERSSTRPARRAQTLTHGSFRRRVFIAFDDKTFLSSGVQQRARLRG